MRFPLLRYIEGTVGLSAGDWTVLFYRNGCHVCHDVMRDIEARIDSVSFTKTRRVRSCWLPWTAKRTPRWLKSCEVSVASWRVSACAVQWLAGTPVCLRIHDGICIESIDMDPLAVRYQGGESFVRTPHGYFALNLLPSALDIMEGREAAVRDSPRTCSLFAETTCEVRHVLARFPEIRNLARLHEIVRKVWLGV